MFRTLIYSSSGACDCVDELPHRSSCSQFVVCWSFCCGWYLVVFVLQAEACDIKLVFHSSSMFYVRSIFYMNFMFQMRKVKLNPEVGDV